MIGINEALQNILDAVYGEEVRTSIHDSIYIMSQICDMKFGTDIATESDPISGYYEGAVYLNINTFDMFKVVNNAWHKLGNTAGRGIVSITKTDTNVLVDTYTIHFTRGDDVTFDVTNGNGIDNITKTGTDVLKDTYTITYTNGTTKEFDVMNGKGIKKIELLSTNVLTDTYRITFNDDDTFDLDIKNGKGIASIAKTDTTGIVDTYTITFNDGTTQDFTVTNGNGITSITKTATVGYVDTYTITFDDDSTETFDVHNGENAHVFLKYSENADGTDFADTPTVQRKYMGIYSGNRTSAPTDKADYQWVKYIGENGSGTGDMLEDDYVKAGGTGVVLKAKELDGAESATLKKLTEVDGKLLFDGKAIASGGSLLHIYTEDFVGETVHVTYSDPYTGESETLEETFDSTGLLTVNITGVGTVTASVTEGSETYTASTNAPYYGIFAITINRGEMANVSLNIDNDELFNSVVVTCVNESDSTKNQTATLTKATRSASFAIPTGDTYHIEYGAANNYIKPANTASKVAVMSSATNYTGNYQFLMEKVLVELSSETVTPTTVANRVITLVDETANSREPKSADSDGKATFYVENGHTFHLEYESIPLYSNTPSASFTAVKNTERTITFMYEYIMGQAEVTLTADTEISMENRVVTLHDVTAGTTQTGSTDSNGVVTFNVEQNHEYYVTGEEIALNYIAPSQHYTSVKGQTQSISLAYEYVMESCTITVTKNGGALNLEGISVALYDTNDDIIGTAKTTDAGGVATFNVMQNTQYYAKAETKYLYLNSASETYTAVRGNSRAISLEYDYNAEDVTVTLSTDTQSLDVTTKSVTLYDINTSVPTTKAAVNGVATFNVLAGHQYYIEAEDVTNFVQEKTPANSASNPITATKQGTKAIGLEYKIFTATIVATYPDGSTCVLKKNGVTLETASSNPHTFTVHETGTYVVEATDGADQTTQSEVAVDTYGQATSIELNYGWLVGMIVHEDTATPNARVELIEDATGWSFATMNMSTHMYDLGGFANWKWLEDVYPAMVHSNGVEDYKLDPTNYAKKIDGVTNSDVSNTSYDGGAFCKIPKLYKYEKVVGSDRYVYFASNRNIMKDRLHITDNDFEANGFVDELTGSVVENDHAWLPMFYGTNVSGKMRSLATGYPLADDGTANEFTYITAVNANRAAFMGGSLIETLMDICYMMFGSTDSQASIGRGYNTGGSEGKLKNNEVIGAGQDGLFYGSNDNKSLNKIFHSIALGSYQILQRDPYLIQLRGKIYVSPHYKYSLTAAGYIDTGVTRGSTDGWSYTKKKGHIIKGWGAFVSDDSATNSTGYADGLATSALGENVASRLGMCNYAKACGLSCVVLNVGAGYSCWFWGASVVLFPPVTP